MNKIPLDKNGKPMKHPNEVADIVNDSMIGAIQLKNYKLDYKEALERLDAPIDPPENICPTCGEKCYGDFCNKECFNNRDI